MENRIAGQIRSGMAANLPVAASVIAYGSVLGVLAAQKGVGWGQLLFMNLSIFAGSAQFVMVDMWNPPLPVVEMVAAVFIINFRYLLIGASLRSLFQGASLGHKSAVMHLVADENWAVTMAADRKGGTTTYFLLGGGVCLILAWSFGTLLGHRMGAAIQNPEMFALDFAFLAVFTALAVSLWRGKSDTLPWVGAALFSILGERFLPGKWYVVTGGIGGALLALWHTTAEQETAK